MPRRIQRFTIYDRMEEAGIFDANPANPYSRDNEGNSLYRGPVEFPKMFYHPEGAERVINPGELINTPIGPKLINEQRELVWEIAKDQSDETRLRSLGWHDSPRDAIRAGGRDGPPADPSKLVAELQAQIAALQAEKNAATVAVVNSQRASGAVIQRTGPAPTN